MVLVMLQEQKTGHDGSDHKSQLIPCSNWTNQHHPSELSLGTNLPSLAALVPPLDTVSRSLSGSVVSAPDTKDHPQGPFYPAQKLDEEDYDGKHSPVIHTSPDPCQPAPPTVGNH
ncbi:hypothetical protein Pst134EA_009827 [Puccinia striiformis f. sp. tritici]|uniref:Uncharacterized protein n=1 Tax=Puccinia striiformis f. sp. tritici PST-78 TaxID=1165861 RepID=A0A0L0V868_9BASI|nr:hypothetical protein Pst134EA_009827 [Puccinia striiformis f. sp. tritici]KAH9469306.1 hypothetical protein Pst134EA_009827 [Puccinia striiformis f. sp. tritici]KNE95199.1 hypothetical protein PSTG_11465 [Puccinia striiformis f. sp. tritici PST-78]